LNYTFAALFFLELLTCRIYAFIDMLMFEEENVKKNSITVKVSIQSIRWFFAPQDPGGLERHLSMGMFVGFQF